MITVVVIIIIGVVAYWHYTQGFFSSTLSAILATLAAVFAVGWHEKLTDMLLKGRFADEANAITLVAIFVVFYSLARYVFDKLVPGNLRFPALVDKIGAGVMGVIAGIVCAGIVLIAAQTLPFSESVINWERYEVTYDKAATVMRERDNQQLDAKYEELTAEKFLNDQPNSLLVPADEIVLSLVGLLSSENGALSAGRPWTSVHPDFLQELFGQRMSQQPAARHCALADKVSVSDVRSFRSIPQFDQERCLTEAGVAIGTRGKRPASELKPLEPNRKAGANNVLLRISATLDPDNREIKTNLVSFPAAAVRLCLPVSGDPSGRLAINCFPLGTIESGTQLFVNQPDDMLFAYPSKIIDFVFEVPLSSLQKDNQGMRLPPGTFFEFKRLAREDLGGRLVPDGLPAAARESAVLRKALINTKATAQNTPNTSSGGNTPAPGPSNPNVPLLFVDASVSSNGQLPFGINVGSSNPKEKDMVQAWGSCSLDEGKFVDIDLAPVQSVQLISRGANLVNTLGAAQGKRAVIVWGRNREDIQDKWAWAPQTREFTYADSAGTRYPLAGVIVKLKNANGQDMLNIVYNGIKAGPIDYAPANDTRQMRPSEVGLVFVVPQGAQMGNLMFKADVVRNLPANVN